MLQINFKNIRPLAVKAAFIKTQRNAKEEAILGKSWYKNWAEFTFINET
jgi:hypothetical protein